MTGFGKLCISLRKPRPSEKNLDVWHGVAWSNDGAVMHVSNDWKSLREAGIEDGQMGHQGRGSGSTANSDQRDAARGRLGAHLFYKGGHCDRKIYILHRSCLLCLLRFLQLSHI
jgi:hypothetical protein